MFLIIRTDPAINTDFLLSKRTNRRYIVYLFLHIYSYSAILSTHPYQFSTCQLDLGFYLISSHFCKYLRKPMFKFQLSESPYFKPFSHINYQSLTSTLHTQQFAISVLYHRTLLTLLHLSHERNICFYFADKSARTSSDTASTCIDFYYQYCEAK